MYVLCSYVVLGINTEGVLQQQGRKEEVEDLRDAFDRGDVVDLDTLQPTPHSVGDLLKVFIINSLFKRCIINAFY